MPRPPNKKRPLQIVVEEGRPAAVILDIDQYEEMLERLEDLEDIQALAKLRQHPLRFAKLDDIIAENGTRV